MSRLSNRTVAAFLLCVLTFVLAPLAWAKSTPQLVRDTRRSIVQIRAGGDPSRTRIDLENMEDPVQAEPESSGTGFLYTFEGDIITNNHVVEGSKGWENPELLVYTVDGVPLGQAKLIGRDELTDVAVIRISKQAVIENHLKPLRFADPTEVEVGQDVVAIGFALDLGGTPTVTRGVVSSFNRTSKEQLASGHRVTLGGLIQTDAAINHGNSGGPLLSLDGEVVGINTLMINFTDLPTDELAKAKNDALATTAILLKNQAKGINYAVSGRVAEAVAKLLMAEGRVSRSALGMVAKVVSSSEARSKTRRGYPLSEGLRLMSIDKRSPLDAAGAVVGIKKYDVLRKVGDEVIRNHGDLTNAMIFHRPGTKVSLTFDRIEVIDGSSKVTQWTAEVTLPAAE